MDGELVVRQRAVWVALESCPKVNGVAHPREHAFRVDPICFQVVHSAPLGVGGHLAFSVVLMCVSYHSQVFCQHISCMLLLSDT